MKHDRLFKTLLEAFFADFLLLLVPASAGRLRLAELSFLDKEQCTEWPDGERREVDLLVRVPVEGSAEVLLIHVEIEARSRAGMGLRLWKYYNQIRQRHNLPVLPILVNLRGGRAGAGMGVLEEGFEPLPTLVFRYRVLGLARCPAGPWLARPEPVAWALAALMDPGPLSRAQLKVECLRRVRDWTGTGLHKDLLVNWMESYIQLTGEDAAEYERLLSRSDNKEIDKMQLTWAEKLEAKGEAKGVARTVDQMRRAVLRSIEDRFGEVPESVRQRVAAIQAPVPLVKLASRVLVAESPADLFSRRRLPRH